MNENQDTTYKNITTANEVLRRIFITLNVYLKRRKMLVT